MSRIKRKPKRFYLEDVIRINIGKAVRIVDKILNKRFIYHLENDKSSHIKEAKELFLSRHPEVMELICKDELCEVNGGDFLIIHTPTLELERKFLKAFYSDEDKFRGVDLPEVHPGTDVDGVLYPLQLISSSKGYCGGLPLSPIVLRRNDSDVLLHELMHAMSREVTLRLYNNKDSLGYTMNFTKRNMEADEIVAYLAHKIFIRGNKPLDIFKTLKDKPKTRVQFKRVIRKTMWDTNHALMDDKNDQREYLIRTKIMDPVIYKVKHKHNYNRKSFK